jgi:hypothetical protein
MDSLEIVVITLVFIFFIPNIVFKPFFKNKWYNVLLCSLFFIFSIYFINTFFIYREGITTPTTNACEQVTIDRKKSNDAINEYVRINNERNSDPNNTNKKSRDEINSINEYNTKINKDNDVVLNNVCKNKNPYNGICSGRTTSNCIKMPHYIDEIDGGRRLPSEMK